jgi:hypothetical protein
MQPGDAVVADRSRAKSLACLASLHAAQRLTRCCCRWAAAVIVDTQSVAVCLSLPAPQESGKGTPAAAKDHDLRARLAPLIQLAEDTGAVLVPVVAVGEETASRSMVEALLMPAEKIVTKVRLAGVISRG